MDETTNHLLWKCNKILQCGYEVFARIGWDRNDIALLSSSFWLLKSVHSKDENFLTKTFIAVIVWLIWKNRYNLVFQGCTFNYNSIVARAWFLCLNFNKAHFRKMHCRSVSDHSINIFTDSSWASNSRASGLGFIIICNLNSILLVGAMSATCDSPIMAKLAAINLAVNFCLSNGWISDNIYCDCQGVSDLLKNFSACMAWHINEEFCKLKRNLDCFPHTCVEYIPREDNEITDILVDFGRHNHQLSLFHQGLDWPS